MENVAEIIGGGSEQSDGGSEHSDGKGKGTDGKGEHTDGKGKDSDAVQADGKIEARDAVQADGEDEAGQGRGQGTTKKSKKDRRASKERSKKDRHVSWKDRHASKERGRSRDRADCAKLKPRRRSRSRSRSEIQRKRIPYQVQKCNPMDAPRQPQEDRSRVIFRSTVAGGDWKNYETRADADVASDKWTRGRIQSLASSSNANFCAEYLSLLQKCNALASSDKAWEAHQEQTEAKMTREEWQAYDAFFAEQDVSPRNPALLPPPPPPPPGSDSAQLEEVQAGAIEETATVAGAKREPSPSPERGAGRSQRGDRHRSRSQGEDRHRSRSQREDRHRRGSRPLEPAGKPPAPPRPAPPMKGFVHTMESFDRIQAWKVKKEEIERRRNEPQAESEEIPKQRAEPDAEREVLPPQRKVTKKKRDAKPK